jgi:hypothetical protein
MTQLLWAFDGQSRRATATVKEGSYLVVGSTADAWTAAFRQFRDGTERILPGGSDRPFASLAEALTACQRHCDQTPAGCTPRQAKG